MSAPSIRNIGVVAAKVYVDVIHVFFQSSEFSNTSYFPKTVRNFMKSSNFIIKIARGNEFNCSEQNIFPLN